MLRNMATSLLQHETIRTTVPKAKELRRVVEPLITLAKVDSIAMRRLAYARLRDDNVVDRLHTVARHDWEHSHPLDLSDAGLLADLEDRIKGSAEILGLE